VAKLWRWQSGVFARTVAYRSCLTVGVNEGGLYLAVWFLFRMAHSPLFIPWGDVKLIETKRPSRILLRLKNSSKVLITIDRGLAEKISHASHGLSPIYAYATATQEHLVTAHVPRDRWIVYCLYASIGTLAALLLAIGVATASGLGILHRLAQVGIATQGKVEVLQLENHNLMIYSYEVDNRTYRSPTKAEGVPSVGDKLTVFYDPSEPAVSIVGNPKEQERRMLLITVLMSLFVSGLLLYVLWKRGFGRYDS
jgi:hypothetical protein